MNIFIDEIDEYLKQFLQCDVEFCLNKKTIKSGKLLLFEHGYFNYVFFIQTKSKKTSIKIPFPFDCYLLENDLNFDYTLDKFTSKIPEIEETLKKIKIDTPSKFFDNVLKIKCV